MKNNVKVILNEQNELIRGQQLLIISLLGEKEFLDHEVIKCPLSRWSRQEMDEVLDEIFQDSTINESVKAKPKIVFAVPIPYMVAMSVKRGARVFLYVRNKKILEKGKVTNEYELVEI